jgi:hypothetical protein
MSPATSSALNVRETMAERQRAREFWASLSTSEKWSIGDELVLGMLDDWAWFVDGRRPSRVFLDELDYLRVLWESGQ